MEKFLIDFANNTRYEKLESIDKLSRDFLSKESEPFSLSELIHFYEHVSKEDPQIICKVQFFLQLMVSSWESIPDIADGLLYLVVVQLQDDRAFISDNALYILQQISKKSSVMVVTAIGVQLRKADNKQLKLKSLSVLPQLASEDSLSQVEDLISYLQGDSDEKVVEAALACKQLMTGKLEESFLPLEELLSINVDWRTKQKAIDKLSQDCSFSLSNKALLVSFIRSSLSDSNSNVLRSLIGLIEKILKKQEFCTQDFLEVIMNNCLSRLGDNKIIIRQLVFRLFKSLISVFPPENIFPKLSAALEEENWLIRIEVLHLLIVGAVKHSERYDFTQFVPLVAKMLDDPKPKVRFSATEALATIEYFSGREIMTNLLSPIVDSEALNFLYTRFDNRQLPIITENNIEFPRINSMQSVSSPYLSSRNLTGFTEATAGTMFPIGGVNESVEEKKSIRIKSMSRIKDFQRKKLDLGHSNKTDEIVYLKHENLEPIDDPISAIKSLSASTESNEWTEVFEALNIARRLLKNHTTMVSDPPSVRIIIKLACKHAESLRSSLCKNALIVIGEACESLAGLLDRYTSEILRVLIGKVCDSSSFISSEAYKSVDGACFGLSESRIVSSIQKHFSRAKNPESRSTICLCFNRIFNKLGETSPTFKDFRYMAEVLVKYMFDASPNVRSQARQALVTLEQHTDLSSCLKDFFDQQTLNKIVQALKFPQSKSNMKFIRKNSMHRDEPKPNRLTRSETNVQKIGYNVIPKITLDVSSIDSKTRYNGILLLESMIIENASSLISNQKLPSVIDILAKVMEDRNLKVLLKALEIFIRVIPILGKALTPYLGSLMDACFSPLSSKNENVRGLATEVCILLEKEIEPVYLVLAYLNIVLDLPPKSKAFIIDNTVKLLPEAYKKKPKTIENKINKAVAASFSSELSAIEGALSSINNNE